MPQVAMVPCQIDQETLSEFKALLAINDYLFREHSAKSDGTSCAKSLISSRGGHKHGEDYKWLLVDAIYA
jgi:hypothetical protein